MAVTQSRLQGKQIKFIYPSSIAVYGLPDVVTKHKVGKIKEDEWTEPRTMYGINKLYCERLGRYYTLFTGNSTHSRWEGMSISDASDFPDSSAQ